MTCSLISFPTLSWRILSNKTCILLDFCDDWNGFWDRIVNLIDSDLPVDVNLDGTFLITEEQNGVTTNVAISLVHVVPHF